MGEIDGNRGGTAGRGTRSEARSWRLILLAAFGVICIAGTALAFSRGGEPTGSSWPIAGAAAAAYAGMALALCLIERRRRAAAALLARGQAERFEALGRIADLIRSSSSGAESFGELKDQYLSVQGSIKDIRSQKQVVNEGLASLLGKAEKTLESVRQTAGRAEGFDARVDDQNAMVLESTASINQMAASLESMAKIAAEKTNAATRLHEAAAEGVRQLASIRQAFDTATSRMASLLDVNKMVGDIADRTNLLAMNAAIEAAHAGDRGRGFAVVADEIRKLAATTTQNSGVIAGAMKDLAGGLEGAGGRVEAMSRSIGGMALEIGRVSKAFEELSASILELSGGGSEINKAMQSLQDGSLSIREGSRAIIAEQLTAEKELVEVCALTDSVKTALKEVDSIRALMDQHMKKLFASIEERSAGEATLREEIVALASVEAAPKP